MYHQIMYNQHMGITLKIMVIAEKIQTWNLNSTNTNT